jgi:hypothetical protein
MNPQSGVIRPYSAIRENRIIFHKAVARILATSTATFIQAVFH